MNTGHTRLTLDSRIDEIRRIGAWLEAALPENEFAAPRAEIEGALVELVSNIIRHGFNCRAGQSICLELERAPAVIRISIHDGGTPVPPWARERADTVLGFDPMDLERLPEGGIGLALAIAAMDGFAYEEGSGANVTRLVKTLQPPTQP